MPKYCVWFCFIYLFLVVCLFCLFFFCFELGVCVLCVSIFLWLTRVTRSARRPESPKIFFGSRWHTDFHALHATDDHQTIIHWHVYWHTFYAILYMLRGYSSLLLYTYTIKSISLSICPLHLFLQVVAFFFFIVIALSHFFLVVFQHIIWTCLCSRLYHTFFLFHFYWWLCEKNGVCKGAKRTTTKERENKKWD